ncbi:MAG: hypothetical protein M0Z88_03065 [Actinomycetota bacterium]|nr:hypothetical protein [Actinomycetota bacterium]MDA8398333.1 hypothetical protein [Actinomycetota bacterium]
MAATYEDANLVIQLVRWSTEMGLDDAMKEIFSDGFDASDGASDSPAVRKILTFGETVGSLVKHGVLDWDLLSDLFWIDGMWNRVAAHAEFARNRLGEPRIYEHFEALAARNSD